MEIIRVSGVHKKFRVYYDKGSSIKEKLLFRNRNHYEERWVLKGIDFTVDKGEAIGLIGQNGCGKSTLLKLMSKIIYPDQGKVEIKGRVSSLIELGAGFHPDMTGRENIYTNASIFGLSKKKIDARLNDIIAFSELEEFIDNPVRTYSSGMYMRLAFSVAIHVDANVLLIDEILAVGDSNFQAKCLGRLRELKAEGMTIVLVTHNTGTIEEFCTKAIWLNDGKMAAYGKTHEVVGAYLSYMNQRKLHELQREHQKKQEPIVAKDEITQETFDSNQALPKEAPTPLVVQPQSDYELNGSEKQKIDTDSNHFGLGYIEITKACLYNAQGQEAVALEAGKPATIEICYRVHVPQEEYLFGMGFYTMDNVCIFATNTRLDQLMVKLQKERGKVSFCLDSLELLAGKYILQVAIVDGNEVPMDFYRDYSHFDVISNDRAVGVVSMKRSWVIQ